MVSGKPKSRSSSVIFFVDGFGVGVDVGSGEWEGDGAAGGGLFGVEAAVEVLGESGGEDVLVLGDELDADVVEGEGFVAVVGDDDADGEEAVLHVGVAEEAAVGGLVAGLGGYGDVLFGMVFEEGVLVGGLGGWGFPVGGTGGGAGEWQGQEGGQDGEGAERVHSGLIMIVAAGQRKAHAGWTMRWVVGLVDPGGL